MPVNSYFKRRCCWRRRRRRHRCVAASLLRCLRLWARLLLLLLLLARSLTAQRMFATGRARYRQHAWVANFCDHIWSCFKANRCWRRESWKCRLAAFALSRVVWCCGGGDGDGEDVSGNTTQWHYAVKVFSIFARLIKKTGIFAFKKDQITSMTWFFDYFWPSCLRHLHRGPMP